MWENIETYLAVKDLIDGFVYKIYARNGCVGVWDADKKGFKLARNKWGNIFIDIEYHWDVDPTFGTAKPYEMLWLAPKLEENDLIKYLQDIEVTVRKEQDVEIPLKYRKVNDVKEG